MFVSFYFPMLVLLLVILLFLVRVKLWFSLALHDSQLEQLLVVKYLFFRKKLAIRLHKGGTPSLGDIAAYRGIARKAIANIEFSEFQARIKLGFSDAYLTAMACGAANTAGSLVLAYIFPQNKLYLQKHISITPEFERECLDIDLNCILSASIANIISVMIQIHNGRRSDKIASNRKHDENDDGRNTRDDRC